MREFKFRVWDKEIKAFTHWYRDPVYITLDQGLFRHTGGDEPWRDLETEKCEDNRYIIQQFTGCRDNNGKEIYEGDIVKGANTSDYGEVRYDSKYAMFALDNYALHAFISGIEPYDRIEVIGNIFENPDLLQEANNAG